MPNDPAAWTGRGGDGDPTIAPFTADHTPNPGATTSITDELTGVPRQNPAPTGGGGDADDDRTIAPEVTAADAALTMAPPAPADDPESTIAPPGAAYVPGAPLVPGTKLGTRYTVLKILGRGGMGAVYQAYDDELGVAVAIKTILSGEGSDAHTMRDQVSRFKSELLLARQVTHKNVVRIHDLGEFSGLKYITMSYVAGETLAALVARNGPLPVPQVLALARQIADGMAAAHEVGVVHRDMKPENVMVTPDGQALIMDFGIASSSQGGSKDGGPIVGTIPFMAPEQARGQVVDARADIYAFGLILYDMLLGRKRQKRHASAMDELRSRFAAPPASLRSERPDVPEALEAVIMRALQPAPTDRYADTAALKDALSTLTDEGHLRPVEVPRARWPAIAASTVMTALIASGVWWWITPPVIVEKAPVSVLVADFENKTGDPVFDGVVEQALGLGIESASFVTQYPRRDALRVAAGIKAGARLDEQTARLVALREGVARVLVGSVEAAGSQFRITARLLGAGNDQSVEESSLTVEAADRNGVLDAVGRLAGDVREALGDETVGEAEGTAPETFTAASLEAAAAYAKAQDLQIAGRVEDAITQYQETLRLDPELGRAYSGLAAQYTNLGRTADAEASYELALARLDRMTDREKYRTRGSYYLFARKPELAAQEFTALVKAYPADTSGLSNLALASFYQRDMAQALEQGRRAAAIFPNNVLRQSNVALYAMYAGQFEDAIAASLEVHELNPTHLKAFVARALSQLALGRFDQARATYEALGQTSAAGASFAAIGLADLAAAQGRFTDAVAALTAGIAADDAAGFATPAATKRVALAEVLLVQGQPAAARREAEAAAEAVESGNLRAAAGLVLAAAGAAGPAERLAGTLATSLEPDPQAFGRLVLAELALARKDPRKAVDYGREAQKLADTWQGRVILGRAYLGVNAFPEAYTEFEAALKRAGEASAVYLDDVPTYRLLVPVYYYMGLAQEGLKSPAAKASFETYLGLRGEGDRHPFLDAARQRTQAP
ncbi:MAG: protein kinase [Acidobacteria bacterium]|nr:protein kinase [Acidobacteriota bacterium]